MRSITRISFVFVGSAALIGSMALPASAADTTTTAEVPVGTLSVSAAPASAALGAIVPGTTASVDLAGIQVTDDRAGTAGWVASVSSSSFNGATETTPGTPDNVISAVNASYTPATATVIGTDIVVTASAAQVDLSAAKNVQTASAVNGNNSASWDASLSLAVPSDALADTYTAVVTHSVL